MKFMRKPLLTKKVAGANDNRRGVPLPPHTAKGSSKQGSEATAAKKGRPNSQSKQLSKPQIGQRGDEKEPDFGIQGKKIEEQK